MELTREDITKMTNEQPALKPCPFCGGIAETNVYGATGEWTVKCPCGAEMNRLVYTEAEAIEAWNTRAERTCQNLVEEVDWTDYHDFECSECHASMRQNGNAPGGVFTYCPNCGAKVVD